MEDNLKKTAEKAILSITDLDKMISRPETLSIPGSDQIFSDKRLESLRDALEIVDKYKSSNALISFDPLTIRSDLVHIAALNINVAEISGFLAGRIQVTEDALKLAKAQVHLNVKKVKEDLENIGKKVNITQRDIECLAREKSKDLVDSICSDKSISEYVRFTYFAIQEFNRILQSSCSRLANAEDTSGYLS